MPRLRRSLALCITVLVLSAIYQVLATAFQILALPRFEIPYIEPGDRGSCGFGSYEPDEWLVIALLALGMCWAPLAWAKARRALVTRCLAGLALLTAALGLSWLCVVGSGVRAILNAVQAWHLGDSISHPGFDYFRFQVLLAAAQIGLGIAALAFSLLSLWARLQHGWRFRAEAVTAARAGLLLVLGAALSVRSAWLNEAGCFPLWPALRRDAPESWDGLWTTSVGFYAGCSLLAFVAWPMARRWAWFLAPIAFGALYAFQHGSWGPRCTCQIVDVPGVHVSTIAISGYPATRDSSFGPSQAAQLRERGLTWQQEQFDSVPAFFGAVSRQQRRRRELASVLGPPPEPGSLVLRWAPGTSLEQLSAVVAGARAADFTSVTFELGHVPWHIDLHLGIRVPMVSLLRVPVRIADGCSCQLDFGPEQSADAWLRRVESKLIRGDCCVGAEVEGPAARY